MEKKLPCRKLLWIFLPDFHPAVNCHLSYYILALTAYLAVYSACLVQCITIDATVCRRQKLAAKELTLPMLRATILVPANGLDPDVSGKKCFQCQDLPHPADCRRVIECPNTDNCYVDEIITGAGAVLYNSGCRTAERCHGAGKRDIVARGDILTCDVCCADELCNFEGCGQTAPSRSTRGPYCFACDAQTSETNCRNVALCATDQTCSIGYSDIDHFYVTGCMQTTKCHTLQSHVHPVPVGRRGTIQSCSSCCIDDFCNINCTKHPVDGQWSAWGQWEACSVTCGEGLRHKSRHCDNPAPQNHGKYCVGATLMAEKCKVECSGHTTMAPVPVNGQWSEWVQWSACSVTCGQGRRQRYRPCDNPKPSNHGHHCIGLTSTSEFCVVNKDCHDSGHTTSVVPVTGKYHWSDWSQWSNCSVTCGDGFRRRSRYCSSTHPLIHSYLCGGSAGGIKQCHTHVPCGMNHVTEGICHRHGYVWLNTSNGHGCMKLSKHLHGWDEGRQLCHHDGAELIVVNSLSKQMLMAEFLKQQHMQDGVYVWIGLLTNQGSNAWQWAGHYTLPMHYNNFYHTVGRIPSFSGFECAATANHHGAYYWYPKTCSATHYVLCEM